MPIETAPSQPTHQFELAEQLSPDIIDTFYAPLISKHQGQGSPLQHSFSAWRLIERGLADPNTTELDADAITAHLNRAENSQLSLRAYRTVRMTSIQLPTFVERKKYGFPTPNIEPALRSRLGGLIGHVSEWDDTLDFKYPALSQLIANYCLTSFPLYAGSPREKISYFKVGSLQAPEKLLIGVSVFDTKVSGADLRLSMGRIVAGVAGIPTSHSQPNQEAIRRQITRVGQLIGRQERHGILIPTEARLVNGVSTAVNQAARPLLGQNDSP